MCVCTLNVYPRVPGEPISFFFDALEAQQTLVNVPASLPCSDTALSLHYI